MPPRLSLIQDPAGLALTRGEEGRQRVIQTEALRATAPFWFSLTTTS